MTDTSAPHWLFTYGTLQLPMVQLDVFGRTLEGEEDELRGYTRGWIIIGDPHVIATSGSDMHAILQPAKDPATSIAGLVLPVTDADLVAADAYEGDDYVRIEVTLASGRRAFVYVDPPRA